MNVSTSTSLAVWLLGVAMISMPTQSSPAPVWTQRAPLPLPVAGYMAGVMDDRLVIAGGSYWQDGRKHWTTRVQRFDPHAGVWQDAAPLPAPRSDAASVVAGRRLYLFGGIVANQAQRDVLAFDGSAWTAVPQASLPAPRAYATAATDGRVIYLAGGLSKPGDYLGAAITFWMWRPGAERWEALPSMPGPGRINHAMAVIDGRVYVFAGAAGRRHDVRNLDDVIVYDPATRTWSDAGRVPGGLRASWAVARGSGALLVGGYTDTFVSDVLFFEPGRGVRPAGHLPHAIADAKFFAIGDRLIGAGGEAAPGVRGAWTFEGRVPETR